MRGELTRKFGYSLLIGAGAIALTAVGVSKNALADYPEKDITVIVGYTAGGGIDTYIRVLKKYSKQYLGVDLEIVYKIGGGGNVAHNLMVRNFPKDGYTIAAGNVPNQTVPTQISSKGYRLNDIQWIANFSLLPNAVIVKAVDPYKSLSDLVAAAKKAPGKFKSGVGGAVSGNAVFHYGWTKAAGVNMTIVPYQGGNRVLKGLLGGEIEVKSANMSWGVRFPDKLRVLAVAADKRFPLMKEIPTFKELGINYTNYLTRSLTASSEVSKDKIATLSRLFRKMSQDEAFVKDMARVGLVADFMGHEETSKFVKQYVENNQDIFAQMRARMEKKK